MYSRECVSFPKLDDLIAIACVAVSTVIMAYSYMLGMVMILAFYGIWLSQIVLVKPFVLRPGRDLLFPALFSIYCLFSVFWSDYPGVTIYKGAEYVSLIVCMAIAARLVSVEAFAKGLVVGICFVLLTTLMSNNYSTVYSTGDAALTGFSGSKNQVGFFGAVGAVSAVVCFFIVKDFVGKLVFSFFPLFLSLLCLALSHSAASLVSLSVSLGVVGLAFVLSKIPRGGRLVVFGLVIFFALTFYTFLVAFDLDLYAELLRVLGKNPTLTGRTFLWQVGWEAAQERFLLGYGYSGFWMIGRPEADMLFERFGVSGSAGFQFHNLYVEMLVVFGVVGSVLFLSMVLGVFRRAVKLLLSDGIDGTSVFVLGFFTLFLVRSMAEATSMGPFGLDPLLFFYLVFLRPESFVNSEGVSLPEEDEEVVGAGGGVVAHAEK